MTIIGSMARHAGTRFINRDSLHALPGTISDLSELLRDGHSIMVFPEGTTGCRGAGGTLRRAVFQAAVDAAAPSALRRSGSSASRFWESAVPTGLHCSCRRHLDNDDMHTVAADLMIIGISRR